jgi:hypothetical protein
MEITEDNFDEVFKPIVNHIERERADKSIADEDICSFSGCLYETYGDELEYVRKIAQEAPKKLWTIVEADGVMSYVAGFHYVNRIGYLICEVEFEEEIDIEME